MKTRPDAHSQDPGDEFQNTPDDPYQAAIEEALGDEPRAVELRQMQAMLRERQRRLRNDLQVMNEPKEREHIERELEKLDEQIQVLGEEANISSFVEDAVRVGIEMRKLQEGF